MRKVEDFRVSKYAISTFTEKDSCKKKWFESVVKKSIPKNPPSEQMIKGIYFETMCFGANSGGEELPDMGFMMLKNGSPNVELQRIHEQIDRYKSLMNPDSEEFIGIYPKSYQVLMETDKNKIIIDILGEDDFEVPVIIDLKFTADVNQTYGDFAWGRNPNDINWDQMVIYSKVYEELKGVKPRMMTLVFDASKNMGIKLFEIKVSDSSKEEIEYTTDMILSYAKEYEEKGAPVKPSESNCSTCPLDCDFRFEKSLIEKLKVYV